MDLALNIILLYAIFSTPIPSKKFICFSMLARLTMSFCKFIENLVATTSYFLSSQVPEKVMVFIPLHLLQLVIVTH